MNKMPFLFSKIKWTPKDKTAKSSSKRTTSIQANIFCANSDTRHPRNWKSYFVTDIYLFSNEGNVGEK